MKSMDHGIMDESEALFLREEDLSNNLGLGGEYGENNRGRRVLREVDASHSLVKPQSRTGICCSPSVILKLCLFFSMLRQWWVVREVVTLGRLAVPIILTLFFQQLLFMISLLYVGHITGKSLELGAAGSHMKFVNISGVLVGVGLATAADTLCSQTYGSKEYKMVGVVLQRGIFILFLAMFPIWVFWLNTESLLLLLHQPPCVAMLAAQVVQIFCLALPFIFLYTMLQKYLQAQGIVWMFALVGLLSNIISAAAHAILIFVVELGIMGAAVSMVLASASSPLLLLGYIWLRRLHRQTWGGWSWESLRGWGQFARFGVPGLMMVVFEWCSVEISTFVAGSIDQTQLGISSVIANLLNVIYMVPLGLSIAVSIRVGNELGAGNPLGAKRAAHAALGIILCNSVLTGIFLGSTRHVIGRLFTEDEAVIEGVSVVIIVVAVMEISDGVQATVAGILRGSGRQLLGAVVNFVCYYVVGLPLAIVLALVVHMGALGIWIGLAGGNILQGLIFLIVILRTNWQYESGKAVKNVKNATVVKQMVEKEVQEEREELEEVERKGQESGHCTEINDVMGLKKISTVVGEDSSTAAGELGGVAGGGETAASVEVIVESSRSSSVEESNSGTATLPESVNTVGESENSGTAVDKLKDSSATVGEPTDGSIAISESVDSLVTAVVEEDQRDIEDEDSVLLSKDTPAIQDLCYSRLKLLLYRGSFFLAGAVLLLGGGVASYYHPQGGLYDLTNCTNLTARNMTMGNMTAGNMSL